MFYQNNESPIVRNVLGDAPRIELQNHFMQMGKEGKLTTDTVQVQGAPASIADPFFDSMLPIFQPMAEEIFEKKLFPTYSCIRLYRHGDRLPPHKDRPACEFSLSVALAKSEDIDDMGWPLWVEKPDGTEHGSTTDLGEGVFYQGIEREHHRQPCPYQWALQGFWHYIEVDGAIYNAFKEHYPLDSMRYGNLHFPTNVPRNL